MASQPPANDTIKQPPTEKNPLTAARFRKESWWQIIFPVVALTLVALGTVALTFWGVGAAGSSVVADYATILLLFVLFLITLPIVILLFWLSGLVGKGIKGLPPYTNEAHKGMARVYEQVDRWTDRIADGVITFRSSMAGVFYYMKAKGLIPEDKPDSEAKPVAQEPGIELVSKPVASAKKPKPAPDAVH